MFTFKSLLKPLSESVISANRYLACAHLRVPTVVENVLRSTLNSSQLSIKRDVKSFVCSSLQIEQSRLCALSSHEGLSGHLSTVSRLYATNAKGGKAKGKEKSAKEKKSAAKAAPKAAIDEENEDEEETEGEEQEVPLFDIEPFKKLADAAVSHYAKEISNIRTGRPTPGLLESIDVHFSDNKKDHHPLKTFATVTVRNNSMLIVSCFDNDHVKDVARSIQNSPLKLQAREENGEILVPFPKLTLDVIEKMNKLINQEAETTRKSIRIARQKALDASKKIGGAADTSMLREREIGKFVDAALAEVNRLKAQKEAELKVHH